MNIRRIVSIALGVLGALTILDVASPRIPIMGLPAIIIGTLLLGSAILIGNTRSEGGKIRWEGLSGLLSRPRSPASDRTPPDPLLAVRVLRLAEEKGGRLTVSQTAIALNVPIDTATAALDECASKGVASIDVDERNGMSSYVFPEFAPPAQS